MNLKAWLTILGYEFEVDKLQTTATSELPSGVYIVSFTSNEGEKVLSKLNRKNYMFNISRLYLIQMRIATILCYVIMAFSFVEDIEAQVKHDYIWVFSSDIDQSLPNSEGSIIDFNGGEVSIYYEETSNMIGTDNSSFCSENGTLIAYSNGCDVFDSDFDLMDNGEDINPGDVHDAQCVIDNYASIQNSLMLPDPGGNGIYFYHKTTENIFIGQEIVTSGFEILSTYIDISSNQVIEKNKPIHKRVQHTIGYAEAIQHSNGKDWWILDFSEWDTIPNSMSDSLMYVFLIDKDSIYFHHEQPIDNTGVLNTRCSVTGQSAFSADGQTFAMYCPLSGLDLYDFNRETALLSNHRNLEIPATYQVSGISFSPNNRFIYVSNGDVLWQVDLEMATLESGLVLIDEFEEHPGLPASFGKMQLGPDCRIYMSSQNSTPTLHIINHPDEKGEACGFVQRGIELPSRSRLGLTRPKISLQVI